MKTSPMSNNMPTTFELPALSEQWHIHMETCQRRLSLLQRPDKTLVFLGHAPSGIEAKRILLQWLKDYALSHFNPWLKKLSERCQLPYTHLSVRQQRSRWGSCSSEKRINLNMQLLFLPAHLVTHIMIHELCHTVHLNHSTQFWQLVAQHDPAIEQHRQQVRQAHKFLPSWLG